jgi:glyoxylase-like metal-dependent hydrolase (beta-lactamase superfamily II)
MNKAIFAVALSFIIWCGSECPGAEPQFEKVSDHCYYLQLEDEGNVGAVITEEGTLLVDPPQGPDVSLVVEALERVASKTVRWIVFTDCRFTRTGGARFYASQGALLLASARLRTLSTATPEAESGNMTATTSGIENNGSFSEPPSFPWLIFDRQMHLFPSNLEINITALQHKAHTGGDVAVYVPAEKVLFVGGLYEAARYPDIDAASGGNALEWIDGLKQVIDSVPVLKSAIAPAKPESKSEPEKTLEEGVMVVSAHGEVSNLQNMKDLLEACQKLRRDISRAVRAGRTCDSFLAASGTDPYRSYANFEHYAARLFEALQRAADHQQVPEGR